MKQETLERLKGDFDSVRLVDKDAAFELSLELAQAMGEDDHLLFWRKRHPEAGEGYVLLPIPDPALFDDDDDLISHALEQAVEEFDRTAKEHLDERR